MSLDETRSEAFAPQPAVAEKRGLECPKCGCMHFLVVYTEPGKGYIVRRRECRHCGRRITTREYSLSAGRQIPTSDLYPYR